MAKSLKRALDVPGLEEPAMPENQRKFVRLKAKKLAESLAVLVKGHNPALSLSMDVIPESELLRFRITVGTSRLRPRHIALVEGRAQVQWGHNDGRGKELTFSGHAYVAGGQMTAIQPIDAKKYKEMAAKLFAVLKEQGLPESKTRRIKPVWEAAQQMHYRPHAEPANDASVKKENTPLENFEAEHNSYIYTAVRIFARNFRNRYRDRNPIFEDMDASYNHETKRLTLSFEARKGFNTRSPRFSVDGPVSLLWTHGGGRGTKLFFTPEKGLRLTNIPVEPINLTDRTEASATLINMILSAGFLKGVNYVETPEEGICHIFNVRGNGERSTKRRDLRQAPPRRENSRLMLLRRGHVPDS